MKVRNNPQPSGNPSASSIDRLDSWKEIAAYLKRDERTVRRWEAEGLPVRRKLHKKQASVFAYKAEIDAWWHNGRQRLELAAEPGPSRRLRFWFLAGLAVAVLGALLLYQTRGLYKVRWARNQALPEIARLLDQGEMDRAFRLAREAENYVPGDPVLTRLVSGFTIPISIQTNPPGADIFVRTYFAGDQDWLFLGKSPLQEIRVPWDHLRWRISKSGFDPVEAASVPFPTVQLHFTLDRSGTSPVGMVRVPAGTFQIRSASPVELDEYWLDKYEVTNQQFMKFVESGAYQREAAWRHAFLSNGGQLAWKEAMAEFQDATGRIGPSTWELGSFPSGQADFPVSGVSWYEAEAYCEFAGKTLPTIYHWYKAAGLGVSSGILEFSNFSGKGPSRVGSTHGLGPYGNYDMAGNVKEWAWNETGNKRYILGGGWNEPSYMFATEDAQPPLSRSATFGFRCAQYRGPLAASLERPVATLTRDYASEKPVSNSRYRLYSALYSYDRSDLDARTESVDDSPEYWRREKVSFRAAYGDERVNAYLFLPKNLSPPFSTVIYFPGVSSFFEKSSESMPLPTFVPRSGRALLCPIYAGTYERRITSSSSRQTPDEVVQPGSACLPVGPNAARDLIAQWYKDLARAIDYLETRKDIDSRRLAYYGLSLGAVWGPVLTALEPRFKASILVGGGLPFEKLPPQIEPLNFAPQVRIPTIMLNGRYDFMFPVDSSQAPLFRLLGVQEADKRHVLFDSGHVPPDKPVVKESLDWLDRFLGPA